MAVNIEFGNINSFDCTGNPTSMKPHWKQWKLLSFFSRPRISQKIHKNKPYFYIALDRMYRAFLLR